MNLENCSWRKLNHTWDYLEYHFCQELCFGNCCELTKLLKLIKSVILHQLMNISFVIWSPYSLISDIEISILNVHLLLTNWSVYYTNCLFNYWCLEQDCCCFRWYVKCLCNHLSLSTDAMSADWCCLYSTRVIEEQNWIAQHYQLLEQGWRKLI